MFRSATDKDRVQHNVQHEAPPHICSPRAGNGSVELCPDPAAAKCADLPTGPPRPRPTTSAGRSATGGGCARASGYSFADYARFLTANPGWPERNDAAPLGRKGDAARAKMPATVLTFFSRPAARNRQMAMPGWPRRCLPAVRQRRGDGGGARGLGDRPTSARADEQADLRPLRAQASPAPTMTAAPTPCCSPRSRATPSASSRWSAPTRPPASRARVAMQSRWPDAEARYQPVIGQVTSDAGLMMDRARYLRDNDWESAARQLFARHHSFHLPPSRLRALLGHAVPARRRSGAGRATGASPTISPGRSTTCFPPGPTSATKPLGIRDKYTSLMWLGGTAALERPQPSRPTRWACSIAIRAAAVRCRCCRKACTGPASAALAAGRATEAGALFPARRGLSRALLRPARARAARAAGPRAAEAAPGMCGNPTQRTEFNDASGWSRRRSSSASRVARRADFVRPRAGRIAQDRFRARSSDGVRPADRPPGPWRCGSPRMARNKGSAFYVSQAYPTLHRGHRGRACGRWPTASPARKARSTAAAVSHAGARGMMQLMPGTAREQAGKMGIGYDGYRLTSDPAYNVMLGTAYFQRMLEHLGRQCPAGRGELQRRLGQCPQMGQRLWRSAHGQRRAALDRADPVQRDQGLRPAGDREQRRL